jgi:hypothetical protein
VGRCRESRARHLDIAASRGCGWSGLRRFDHEAHHDRLAPRSRRSEDQSRGRHRLAPGRRGPSLSDPVVPSNRTSSSVPVAGSDKVRRFGRRCRTGGLGSPRRCEGDGESRGVSRDHITVHGEVEDQAALPHGYVAHLRARRGRVPSSGTEIFGDEWGVGDRRTFKSVWLPAGIDGVTQSRNGSGPGSGDYENPDCGIDHLARFCLNRSACLPSVP